MAFRMMMMTAKALRVGSGNAVLVGTMQSKMVVGGAVESRLVRCFVPDEENGKEDQAWIDEMSAIDNQDYWGNQDGQWWRFFAAPPDCITNGEPDNPVNIVTEQERMEMYALHISDPEKWDARTLSRKFRVALDRTSAILMLKKLEADQMKDWTEEQRDYIERSRRRDMEIDRPLYEEKKKATGRPDYMDWKELKKGAVLDFDLLDIHEYLIEKPKRPKNVKPEASQYDAFPKGTPIPKPSARWKFAVQDIDANTTYMIQQDGNTRVPTEWEKAKRTWRDGKKRRRELLFPPMK